MWLQVLSLSKEGDSISCLGSHSSVWPYWTKFILYQLQRLVFLCCTLFHSRAPWRTGWSHLLNTPPADSCGQQHVREAWEGWHIHASPVLSPQSTGRQKKVNLSSTTSPDEITHSMLKWSQFTRLLVQPLRRSSNFPYCPYGTTWMTTQVTVFRDSVVPTLPSTFLWPFCRLGNKLLLIGDIPNNNQKDELFSKYL